MTQPDREAGLPEGGVVDWYRRGLALVEQGNPAAAVQLLRRAADAEPDARSVREALARALYDAGEPGEARELFASLTDADPADDYARFGLGLALRRTGDLDAAVEQLALAAAMKPDRDAYGRALRDARAAVRRRAAGAASEQEGPGTDRGGSAP